MAVQGTNSSKIASAKASIKKTSNFEFLKEHDPIFFQLTNNAERIFAIDPAHQEKIVAWDEVYQVKSRVEGIDADIILKINDDCDQPLDLDDFKNQLARKARRPNDRALRSESMKFWRYKLYDWLSNESDDLIEAIWEMIEQRRDDDNYREEYGI